MNLQDTPRTLALKAAALSDARFQVSLTPVVQALGLRLQKAPLSLTQFGRIVRPGLLELQEGLPSDALAWTVAHLIAHHLAMQEGTLESAPCPETLSTLGMLGQAPPALEVAANQFAWTLLVGRREEWLPWMGPVDFSTRVRVPLAVVQPRWRALSAKGCSYTKQDNQV